MGDPYAPRDAIPAMAHYLMYLREQIGSEWWAIVAYHYGIGNTLKLLDRDGTCLELILSLPMQELEYVLKVLLEAKRLQNMLTQ